MAATPVTVASTQIGRGHAGSSTPHVARRIVERMNATSIHVAGRPAVQLERPLPYPAERVWSALTLPDESARWFPSRLTIEPRVGGMVTFAGDPNTPDSTGTVLAYSPQHLVAFSWGSNELRFEVTATTPKECVLKLTDTLTAENEAAIRRETMDIVADASTCARHLGRIATGAASPTSPLSTSSRA